MLPLSVKRHTGSTGDDSIFLIYSDDADPCYYFPSYTLNSDVVHKMKIISMLYHEWIVNIEYSNAMILNMILILDYNMMLTMIVSIILTMILIMILTMILTMILIMTRERER